MPLWEGDARGAVRCEEDVEGRVGGGGDCAWIWWHCGLEAHVLVMDGSVSWLIGYFPGAVCGVVTQADIVDVAHPG